MNGWIHRGVVACLFCGLIGVGSAQAEGGRITFNGAVVVPTCATQVKSALLMVGHIPPDRTFACGGASQLKGHVGTSMYRIAVVRLGSATIAASPLLQYFIGNRASMHGANVKLVTRIYE